MTTTKLSRLALSLVVTLLLLGFSPVLSADTILEISQPSWDFSFNDASGWQSFTVTESSKLTTFGFLLNGVYGAGTKPGTLKLWAGEGTTNFIMEVAANDVLAGSGPYDGVEFFQGDFGGVGLNSGQYTVSFQWTHDWLSIPGTRLKDSYAGGKYNGSGNGDGDGFYDYDLAFFTPGLGSIFDSGGSAVGGGGGDVSAVPEPSSFAMLAIGGLVLGGYAWRKKQRTA